MQYINKNLLYYYGFMLLVLVSWSNPDVLPPLPLRLIYLVALLFPVLTRRSELLPVVLFTAIVISTASYAVSYMPVDGLFVSIIAIFCALQNRVPAGYGIKPPGFMIFMMILLYVVDLMYSDVIGASYSFFITVVTLTYLINKFTPKILHLIAFSLVLISVVLSLEYIFMGDKFTTEIDFGGFVMTRKGWADPNYFGCEIAAGVICAINELMSGNYSKKVRRLLYLCIIISVYTIVTTASRGAILALGGGAVSIVLFSSAKRNTKLYMIFAFLALAVFLLQSHAADLLFARFGNDEGDMGGRTNVWAIKLAAFIQTSPLHWFIGVGRTGAIKMGMDLGFHNDYIAFLCMYGLLGLGSFLALLLYPIRKAAREVRGYVVGCVVFLAIASMSLEPITSGYLLFFYFYLYIIVMINAPQYQGQ